VDLQLVHLAQRDQHGHRDDAAGAQVDALALPGIAPSVAGHELLQGRGERRRLVERALDVLVAEHGAAGGQAGLGFGVLGQLHAFLLRSRAG